MKGTILIFLLFSSISLLGQDTQYFRVNKNIKNVVLTPNDNGNIVMYQVSGLFESAKKVSYIDSANNYEVIVPKWLHLRETNDLNFFGGTLPAINKIENAIVISSVKTDKYQSFIDFKKYIIEDSTYTKGISPKWADDRTFINIDKDAFAPAQFNSYKVSVNRRGNIFVCNYVLIETKTAYLWVQFTATDDTYQINIDKFYEFLKGINCKL